MDIGTNHRSTRLETEPRRQQVERIRAGLHDLAIQLRADLDTVDRPRLRALTRTTADLLDALEQAFVDAEKHCAEPADAALT